MLKNLKMNELVGCFDKLDNCAFEAQNLNLISKENFIFYLYLFFFIPVKPCKSLI